jgi:hypothetical protein
MQQHSSTVLTFTTAHVFGYDIKVYRVVILFDEQILSLPTMLVGFPPGHVNTTSANRTHIKMFVRYNNVRILP